VTYLNKHIAFSTVEDSRLFGMRRVIE